MIYFSKEGKFEKVFYRVDEHEPLPEQVNSGVYKRFGKVDENRLDVSVFCHLSGNSDCLQQEMLKSVEHPAFILCSACRYGWLKIKTSANREIDITFGESESKWLASSFKAVGQAATVKVIEKHVHADVPMEFGGPKDPKGPKGP